MSAPSLDKAHKGSNRKRRCGKTKKVEIIIPTPIQNVCRQNEGSNRERRPGKAKNCEKNSERKNKKSAQEKDPP